MIFKTSDIARICQVSGETAKRWVEERKIKGYRVGTAGHWRVLPRDLALFLREHEIPFPDPEEIGIDLKALCDEEASPTLCWEFHKHAMSEHIRPEGKCEDCLIYKGKCINCYALREELGHKKIYCIYSCDKCPYFRYQRGKIRTGE